jgi:MFS family permease
MVSMHIYSLGAFVIPIEAEFGWTRAAISSGLTIALLMITLFAPVMGLAVDRFGPRRIILPGMVAFSIAVAAISTVGSATWQWWTMWVVVGVMSVAIAAPVWTTGISATFNRNRGLALAVALCGTALSSAIAPIAGTFYNAEFGWRTAYIALAITWFVVAFPLAVLFYRTPLDRGEHAAVREEAGLKPGMEVREGLRSAAFYKILVGTGAISVATVAVSVMIIPALRSFGHSATTAAEIAALLGIASITGRLIAGFLLDRLPSNIVTGTSCLLPVVSCILFLAFPMSIPACAAAAIMVGLALGSEIDASAYLTSRHLGLRRFGTLFGCIGTAMSAGSGVGPMGFSYVYDVTGAYTLGFWIGIPLACVAAVSFFSLGGRPPFQSGLAEAGPAPIASVNLGRA